MLEEGFVASGVHAVIAGEFDYAALDLGRGIEDAFADGEEIFDVVPHLEEHGEDSAGLGAGNCGETLGNFALEHAGAEGNLLAEVEDVEKYLRGDVVGVIADDGKLAGAHDFAEVQFEEIGLDNAVFVSELGEICAEIFDALGVKLHDLDVAPVSEQKLRQDAHAGAHFEHRELGGGVEGAGNALGHVEVSQEMLAEGLFGLNF